MPVAYLLPVCSFTCGHVTLFSLVAPSEARLCFCAPRHPIPTVWPENVLSCTHHFLWKDGVTGPMGYKLEVPPMHPLLSSTVLEGHGLYHRELAAQLPYLQSVLALCRDGFHPDSQGGGVLLKDDGTPLLDYTFTDYVWDGMRRAFLSMTE